MKKLVWHNEKRKVDNLLPYEKNPRKISDGQLEDLKRSIKKFNLAEVPAIDTNNSIIAGNQRVKVLQLLGRGDEEIDVRVPNRKLTPEEYEQYLLTSNAVGGEWDFEKLKMFDTELLLKIGFGEDELMQIFDDGLETEDDNFDAEKELAEIKETNIQPGDLFQLGPHKLLCADAHDPKSVKRLMGKEKTSFVYCDPIFNIGVSYDKGIGGNQNYGGKVDDNKSDAEYREFLKSGMQNAMSAANKDFHYFCYCDQKYIGMVQDLFRELGIENKRVCMWIKNGQNPTPGVAFSKCYEPCVYGTAGSPYLSKSIQNLNEVMNKEISTGNRLIDDILDELDIWLVKRLAGSDYEHSTSKPPTLHEKAIRRCTKPGDVILDIYGGSGSTLIAAEMLKRKAYLIEIEPRFCQLIVNRYERLTGRKAELISKAKDND